MDQHKPPEAKWVDPYTVWLLQYHAQVERATKWEQIVEHRDDILARALQPFVQFFQRYPEPPKFGLMDRLYILFTGRPRNG